MSITARRIILFLTALFSTATVSSYSQIPGEAGRRYRVIDGVLQEIRTSPMDSIEVDKILPIDIMDSLLVSSTALRIEADSLMKLTEGMIFEEPESEDYVDSVRMQAYELVSTADSLDSIINESLRVAEMLRLASDTVRVDVAQLDSAYVELSKRKQKRLDRQLRYQDSSFVRHNRFFRDSIPISRMAWISVAVPGFSQLYNDQPWKIPILYGTTGTLLYFGIDQAKKAKPYKQAYDGLIWAGFQKDPSHRELLDPIQKKLIRHNTAAQILIGGAALSYMYFLADGVINYSSETTNVKKATTLSMIFPGAGQAFNRSYWHVPFIWGTMATFGYMVDWNNRGYQRFKTAYDMVTATPDGMTPSDEFSGRYSGDFLKNLKNNYRRNRDLCIILLAASYIINIVDAHVDAHMKDYDISDDLSVTVTPTITNLNLSTRGSAPMMGLSLKIAF